MSAPFYFESGPRITRNTDRLYKTVGVVFSRVFVLKFQDRHKLTPSHSLADRQEVQCVRLLWPAVGRSSFNCVIYMSLVELRCVLFCRSLRVELTSWAYPTISIEINSCLQALTEDISTPADIAPSALETIVFYCFMGFISALTYYY